MVDVAFGVDDGGGETSRRLRLKLLPGSGGGAGDTGPATRDAGRGDEMRVSQSVGRSVGRSVDGRPVFRHCG